MKKSKIISLAVITGVVILAIVFISNVIGWGNDENSLRADFDEAFTNRTAFYDKMWKKVVDKDKVTAKADTSFQRMINTVMSNRKDGEGLMMKWITESNPGANHSKIVEMYESLARTIEAEREGFFVQEKVLAKIQKQHKLMITNWPGKFYNLFYDKEVIAFKPITSDRTDNVISTGKDNQILIQ